MSRRAAFVLSLSLVCGAVACAGILGDFTKGDDVPDAAGGDALPNNAPGPDGSSSGSVAEASSPIDAPGDGPSESTGDAGDGGGIVDADAGPPIPVVLTCNFQPNSTAALATFSRGGNSTPDSVYLLGPTATSQIAYVVVPGGANNQADVFRYSANQSFPSVVDVPAPPGQIYDAHRTSDGIVVLAMDYSIVGHSQLVVYKLSETITDGGIPIWQRIPIGPLDPVPQNNCRTNATFVAVNSAADDYIAAIAYNLTPSTCAAEVSPALLVVARTGTAPDGGASAPFVPMPVPPFDAGVLQLDFQRDAIVLDPGSSKIYVFADPTTGGGGGPITGVGPFVFSAPATLPEGGATGQPINLGSSNIFAGGLGYIYSPTTGHIDLGVLGGDLGLAVPGLYVGNAPAGSVATDPITSSYRELAVNGIDGLPVDKSQTHWTAFSGGEHLLLIGRNDLKGGNGVNVYWFDQAGNLRARQAATDGGPDHSALLQNHVVVGADVAFGSPPTGSPAVIGNLLIAITEQTGSDGGVNFYSLTQYNTTCTP